MSKKLTEFGNRVPASAGPRSNHSGYVMDFNLPQNTWTPLVTWLPRVAVFLALGLLLTTGARARSNPPRYR